MFLTSDLAQLNQFDIRYQSVSCLSDHTSTGYHDKAIRTLVAHVQCLQQNTKYDSWNEQSAHSFLLMTFFQWFLLQSS